MCSTGSKAYSTAARNCPGKALSVTSEKMAMGHSGTATGIRRSKQARRIFEAASQGALIGTGTPHRNSAHVLTSFTARVRPVTVARGVERGAVHQPGRGSSILKGA